MEYSYWSITLVAFKFISYLSVAALAGGLTIQCLLPPNSGSLTTEQTKYFKGISRWQITWCLIGLVFTLLHLPVEAAALADTGWQGLTDGLMINIVWQSAIGTQTWLRATGFVLALAVLVMNRGAFSKFSVGSRVVSFIAVLMIASSFVLTGHAVNSGWLVQTILGLHVLAMSIWMGSLWPLYQSCLYLKPTTVQGLMRKFGQAAVVIVLILLLCGVIMMFQFLQSFEQVYTTAYGQMLLLKLTLVAGMLMLAAWHKLVLVPKLLQQQNSQKLKRSIAVEALLGLSVLAVTSVFTTLMGPA